MERPTSGPELYDWAIGRLESGEVKPGDRDYVFATGFVFNSLLFFVRSQKMRGEILDEGDMSRLRRIVETVPTIVIDIKEPGSRKDVETFLREVKIIE